jgi:thymidylate kinase
MKSEAMADVLVSQTDTDARLPAVGSAAGAQPHDAGSSILLVRRLCQSLDMEEIDYCHWKSNNALHLSAIGKNDLDLLVRREHADRFAQLLLRLGFKPAQAPPQHAMPGVLDYYGLDHETGTLVHVHAHYQLVLGDDWTKNYRLPLEQQFLEATTLELGFKVPRPEVEYVVFVIRMVLKHSTWDAVLTRRGRMSKAELDELTHFFGRFSDSQALEIVDRHLPFIGRELFADCVKSLRTGCTAWYRLRVAGKLMRALDAHTRRGCFSNLGLKLWRRLGQAVRRRTGLGSSSKRRLMSGGAMIAIVGGDGAGKSTAVAEINRWLSKDLDVRTLHLGKPPWSWTTGFVRGLLRMGRALGLCPYIEVSHVLYPPPGQVPRLPNYGLLIREVCTARDRYRTYTRGRRSVNQGRLVVCDRFPVPQIKLMDGPLIDSLVRNLPRETYMVRFLKNLEKSYYRSIAAPELLFVLRLDPQIAVERKPEESPEFVRTRSDEIWKLDPPEVNTPHCIDASMAKPMMLAKIRTAIWASL